MLPKNLEILHEGEEALRSESLRRISEWPDVAQHVVMVERSMDLIHHLIHTDDTDDTDDLDFMTLRMLGGRAFNSLAVALKLSLSGYYQASALQLRDVLETIFLLDYFTTQEGLIAEWRTAPEKERRKKFAPAAVRRALDRRDQLTTKKRDATYDMFCRLAAHPTPDSATMLIPIKGSTVIHVGPFLEPDGLEALLSELAVCAVQVASALRALIHFTSVKQIVCGIAFLKTQAEWFKKNFAVELSLDSLPILERLIDELGKD